MAHLRVFPRSNSSLPIDDSFDICRLVAGGDDEASGVLPDPLVLRDREGPNSLQALRV